MNGNDEWLVIFILFSIIPLSIDLLNIKVVMGSIKEQRTPLQYIIINIAIADILAIFNAVGSVVYFKVRISSVEPLKEDMNLNDVAIFIFFHFSHSFYYAIMLSAIFMTIDRFIAVNSVMRYYHYLTPLRSLLLFVTFYIVGLLLHLPAWNERYALRYYSRAKKLYLIFPQQTVIIVACVAVIFVSRWTKKATNEKIQQLIRKKLIFGKLSQQLYILQRRKQSLNDISHLNYFLLVGSSVKLIFIIIFSQFYDGVLTMSHMFTCVCTFVYPIVLIVVFKDLRGKYQKLYKKIKLHRIRKRSRRIHALVVKDENQKQYRQDRRHRSIDGTISTDVYDFT